MNNPLKLKLFDTRIPQILTNGFEIRVTDYKIKENTLDNLPFEKIQNRFFKYLLGVTRKLQILQPDSNLEWIEF